MIIQFNIKTAVAIKIADKLSALFPIPEIPVDPEDPDGKMKPQYTKEQWVKLLIKKWVKDQYNRQIAFEHRQQEIEGLLEIEDIFE